MKKNERVIELLTFEYTRPILGKSRTDVHAKDEIQREKERVVQNQIKRFIEDDKDIKLGPASAENRHVQQCLERMLKLIMFDHVRVPHTIFLSLLFYVFVNYFFRYISKFEFFKNIFPKFLWTLYVELNFGNARSQCADGNQICLEETLQIRDNTFDEDRTELGPKARKGTK